MPGSISLINNLCFITAFKKTGLFNVMIALSFSSYRLNSRLLVEIKNRTRKSVVSKIKKKKKNKDTKNIKIKIKKYKKKIKRTNNLTISPSVSQKAPFIIKRAIAFT